jgi:hypothetical protein
MGSQQMPATSGGDAEAAREASGAHSPTAERIEQAIPAEAGPTPSAGSDSSPGPDDE